MKICFLCTFVGDIARVTHAIGLIIESDSENLSLKTHSSTLKRLIHCKCTTGTKTQDMPIFKASNKIIYFAHVPKCGGSSVQEYLQTRFGSLAFTDQDFYSRPCSQRWTNSSAQHVSVDALGRLFPSGFSDASFAVVRHPVDRLVSEYHYLRDHLKTLDQNDVFSTWLADLEQALKDTPLIYDGHVRPMAVLVPTNATVFRLEDGLDQVVGYLDELVGARAETIRMKRLLVRDTSIPKVVPSENDIAAIERIYASDFERFGYDRKTFSSLGRASPRLRQTQVSPEPIQRHDRSDHAAQFRSMGVNSFLAGDVVNAHASLRFALNCAPEDPQSHALIANTCLRLGALNLATDHAERALRHQPDNRDALVALAGARLRLKDRRAREAVEALALYPELGDFPKLLRIALQVMENEDEHEATLFDLAEYLETHSEDVLAGELLAETFGAFSEAGDKDRLREFLEGVGIKADKADLTPLPKPAVEQEAIVDIIIPVYNAIADLDLCLKSIRKFPSLAMRHIILVDDCSTPQSAAWLIDYQERHADVRLFRNQENLGFTRAVMAGVAQSSAPYMLFLNSDTQVTAHWLDYMLEAMQAGPLTALVGPLSNDGFYQTIRPSHAAGRKPLIELSPDQIAAQVLTITQRAFPRVPFLSGFCLLAHRAAFDLAGGLDCEAFPHGYWEVQDLCLKLIDLGFDSVIADNSYVQHSGGGSTPSERKKDLSINGRNMMFTRYSALRVLMAEAVSSREPEVARHRQAWFERDLFRSFAKMETSTLSSAQLARTVQQTCLKEPPASVFGKEVCLFVTHCPLGAPLEYTLTYIEALKRAGLLVIVCLAAEDLTIPVADPIMDWADGVLIRENSGYDFGAWADLLRRFPHCWDAERLYFVNDSILGPFQSLDPIISSIRDRNAGFFALSEVTSSNSYHAQSFFFGWNKQNLKSIELRRYWDDVINFSDKGQVIFHYEFSIAQLSQDLPDGSQHIAFGFQEIFGVAHSEISLFNTSHSGWKRLLLVGFPFVKTDLLRDGVLHVDTSNWEDFCAVHGADVGSMKRSIEASRLNRLSYTFQRVEASPCPAPVQHSSSSTGIETVAPLSAVFPKTIWMLWLQGWHAAPEIALASRQSWLRFNPSWRVHSLSLAGLGDFLPAATVERLTSEALTPEARSDLIRLELLHRYGGVWADATTICTRALDEWLPARMASGFFAFRQPAPDRPLSTWFLAAEAGSTIVNRWRCAAEAYWRDRISSDSYFWVHDLFAECCKTDSNFATNWHKTLSLTADHEGHFGPDSPALLRPPALQELERLTSNQPVLKLTRKLAPHDGKSLMAGILGFALGNSVIESTKVAPRRLLVAWYGSFPGHGTIGDQRSAEALIAHLVGAGHQVMHATAMPLDLPGAKRVDWRSVDLASIDATIFVCGPILLSHPETKALFARFANKPLVGAGVSLLPSEHSNFADPFDFVLARQGTTERYGDLAVIAPDEVSKECSAAKALQTQKVIGISLRGMQDDYGSENCLSHTTDFEIRRVLSKIGAVHRVRVAPLENHLARAGQTANAIEAAYAKCDLVITSRFHGAITAMRQGVPFIAIDQISGGAKVHDLLSGLGWDHVYKISETNSDELTVAALALLNDPELDRLNTAMQLSIRAANRTLSRLDDWLNATIL